MAGCRCVRAAVRPFSDFYNSPDCIRAATLTLVTRSGNRMTIHRRTLAWIYGIASVLALIGTWGNNLHYLSLGLNPLDVNLLFWKETLANPASRSITVDLFFLGVPVTLWMMMEARRLQMRGIWFYLIGSLLVAISFTVPLFMALRERKLAAADPEAGTPGTAELAWAAALSLGFLAYAGYTLSM